MRWNVVYIALAIILSVSTGFVGQNLKLWVNLVPEKILCFFKVSFPSKQLQEFNPMNFQTDVTTDDVTH